MSVPSSADQRKAFARKPKADVYTVLLGISLLSIVMAIIFLCMELSRYNWDVKASGAKAVGFAPAVSSPAAIRTSVTV